jgi:Mrp family chromosome partitioning ATPase
MGEIADALRRARRRVADPEAGAGPIGEVATTRLRRSGGRKEPRALEALKPGKASAVPVQGADLEACRQLAIRVRSEMERRGARSVAIVSAVQNEGKSTVSCDLAIGLASLSRGREIAILDLDLRKPSVMNVLGLSGEVGIEAAIRGEAGLDQVRHCIERPALDVYPAVEVQHHVHELLVLPSLAEIVQELEDRYEILVVDTTPALLFPDASLILEHVSTCIPVARAGETRARLVRQLVDTLPPHQVLGQLLNGARIPRYRYGYYGYPSDRDASDAESRATDAT